MSTEDTMRAQLEAAVARLQALSSAGDMCIAVERRMHGLRIREGVVLANYWLDVFEPIRERWILRARWRPLQSVSSAEASCLQFLRDRPDQQ